MALVQIPSASGVWKQVATGSLSGTSVSITGLSGKRLFLVLDGMSHNGAGGATSDYRFGVNGNAAVLSTGSSSKTDTYGVFSTANSAAGPLQYVAIMFDLADSAIQAKIINTNYASNGRNFFAFTTSPITSLNLSTESSAISFDAGTYYVWSET